MFSVLWAVVGCVRRGGWEFVEGFNVLGGSCDPWEGRAKFIDKT